MNTAFTHTHTYTYTHVPSPRRIIVGISGASGAVYGARLLQVLLDTPGVESHLVVTDAGWHHLQNELNMDRDFIERMAGQVHDVRDVGASVASGSMANSAMVIAPCSVRTLAAVAHGLGDNLLTRAADMMLKERRRLVLLTTEAPLHLTNLRNMLSVTEMGGIVCPPVPAFHLHPETLCDLVNDTVARTLDLLDVPHSLSQYDSDVELAEAA
ncbi:UbiX family flavin prenyltransferase [Polaromonas glacialis]|uniref:UbiX family flavin prenyltransferase n=1 Tax=Polaromonas glacialis TaxID=866564 RepID=UPI0004966973|nr:UbiX family flavin prenyltransferase [Polaromonas glacialis]